MKANIYKLLCRCVEDGIAYGWNRAHKHVDDPDEHAIKAEIEQAVINEICEWFTFDEDTP